jgi:hypothetical protein
MEQRFSLVNQVRSLRQPTDYYYWEMETVSRPTEVPEVSGLWA